MSRTTQKKMNHIGSILSRTIGEYRSGADGDMVRIWGLWQSAVGDHIASNTRPAAFKGSLLTINVSNSSWLQHLTFLKKELIIKINEALGKEMVKELKFKIGNIQPPRREPLSF